MKKLLFTMSICALAGMSSATFASDVATVKLLDAVVTATAPAETANQQQAPTSSAPSTATTPSTDQNATTSEPTAMPSMPTATNEGSSDQTTDQTAPVDASQNTAAQTTTPSTSDTSTK